MFEEANFVRHSAARMRAQERAARFVAYSGGAVLLVALPLIVYGLSREQNAGAGLLIFAILSAVVGFAALLVGVLWRANARTVAGQIEAVAAGTNVLARWSYTREEWAIFAAGERKRSRKLALVMSAAMLVPLVIVGGVAVAANSSAENLESLWLALLIVAAIILIIAALVFYLPSRALRRGPHVAVVSTDGVLTGAGFYSWRMMGGYLTKVTYEEGAPPVLDFTWMQPGASYRGGEAPSNVRVPVPRGREEEARRVLAQLDPAN